MQETVFFDRKKPSAAKLREFGFREANGLYRYDTHIAGGQFQMTVEVLQCGAVRTQVVDVQTGEEYVLHRMAKAAGEFVGMVRSGYEAVLTAVAGRVQKRGRKSRGHSCEGGLRVRAGVFMEAFSGKRGVAQTGQPEVVRGPAYRICACIGP